MELETREPGSSYEKRSLSDLEERDWGDFELDARDYNDLDDHL